MTSARQIDANRRNARASTGPKTVAGRKRTAQNPRRHGLSLSVMVDPRRSGEIDALARIIVGKATEDAGAQDLARRVVEAQIDLVRLRQARQALFARHMLERSAKLEGSDEFGAVLSNLSKKLTLLDRYERRALSRRKFAVRDLDAWQRVVAPRVCHS